MLMMIHILVAGHTQGDCVEEERKVLLEIKASHMKSYDSEIDHFLPTCVDYGSSTPGDGGNNCCDWETINCSTTTGHVTELSLYNLRGVKDVYMDDESKLWPLNVSLFLHFKELTSLNLSFDFLDKEIMKKGTTRLIALVFLSPGSNAIFIRYLSMLLKRLSFQYQKTRMHVLKNFSFGGLERLSSLKKLEVLDLSGNHDIDNDIIPSLRTLTSLKILDLSHTSFNGYFSTIEFAALENFEMLDLSYVSVNLLRCEPAMSSCTTLFC
ncbi:unnamed protein product [Lactuca virosa]|uniref:Leucine-rich repeat-containing N-terminal plant-type domain-containing protein n=1 Tax=Lactuca virosa TaxID=75947 RepID=A0AAU9NY01_9ASTR|nr:unnamed protein product [Lactuca virosa]